MKTKIINHIKENKILYLLIFVTVALNLLVFIQKGPRYNLYSDDIGYVNSGIEFLKSGRISIHSYDKTAQIMPGMPILIAFFALFFGKGIGLWISLKLFWIFMAVLSVIGLYKTIRLFTNEILSALVTCLLLAADFLWMNSLIMTETPFMLAFIYLIYYTFMLEKKRDWKSYWFIVGWYIFGLMIRPNIGIYPLFLFFYLLAKKYDFKLLMKQGVIAGIILVAILGPWTFRNYKVFNKFIPLTYGTGNPLLLGSYQGYNYPLDEELDYEKEVDMKLPKDMKEYFESENSGKLVALSQYYSLEYDGLKAKYRMREWWKKDPVSMLRSYLIYKPTVMIYNSFYWDTVLRVPRVVNMLFRDIDLLLTLISIIVILYLKKYRAELLLLLSTYLFQVMLYSYTFVFDRYAQTLYFLRFIIIGIGVSIIYEKIKERKKKNEVIS